MGARGDGVEINAGDTAWVIMSTALVMLMTPALGFFYGGLVRRKNVLATLMHSFGILALISVVWVLWGYTLAFGPDQGGLIGGLDFLVANDVGQEPSEFYGVTVPHLSFMMFQGMFAIITPALITGAFAERFRFKSLVIFTIAWSTLVYSPIAHWVWAVGGWLFDFGALDFAGGTVVHISSGVSALVAAIVLGKRHGFGTEPMEPHNLTYTILGAGLLWFGWFGFNAGSALAANGLAANALVVTNTAAAMGAITWMAVTWIRDGHPSVLGAAAGAVAGLVAITPAAGFVDASAAVVIGFGAGILCAFAVEIVKERLGFDDALDVFAVHGVGGIWGALATGLFATTEVNPLGEGLFYGNPEQLWKQIVAVVVVGGFAAIATFVILKAIEYTIGLRVPEEEEVAGLDPTTHGELGYQL
jgi:Amt family ammonium transporter